MAQRLTVEIIGDDTSVRKAFARTERSAKQFQTTMARTSRSIKSSLGMVGFNAPTAAGGGALLLGRQFVQAARNAEIVMGQTQVALRDLGLSWTQYARTIETSSKRISESSAFDDEAVLQSFQVFVRGQKDVRKSFELTELAADVARGRYIDLEAATQLVNKAAMGQVGALRRAGLAIDKNASSAKALDALYKAYSGSAKAYADSATGSSEKLQVAWENLAEQAGGPLSESLANVAVQLTGIVALMERLNRKSGTGGAGAGGFFSWLPGQFKAAHRNFEKVYDILGGPTPSWLRDDANTRPSIVTDARSPDTRSVADAVIAEAKKLADTRAKNAITDANQTIGGITDFINKWTTAGQKWQQATDKFAASQKAAAARRAQNELQRRRFQAGLQNQLGWLEFGIERAGATKTLADDRRALHKKEQWLQNRIRHEGRTLRLVSDLWRVRQQIRDLNKSKAAAGDPLAGLMQVSSRRLANMLAAGTGIEPSGIGRLRQNIAGAEIQVYSSITLDGEAVGRATTRHQARNAHRTARQTSGLRS